MLKLMFIPFRIAGGVIAGMLGKKLAGALWAVVDKRAPPQARYRRVSLGKLALALAIDGAIFRLVRGLVDHATRVTFLRLTGRWPGAEAPADTADADKASTRPG